MKLKKSLASVLSIVTMVGMLSGCGSGAQPAPEAQSPDANNAPTTEVAAPESNTSNEAASNATNEGASTGEVYYLNFKPEQEQSWQKLAKLYTEQTGVNVVVLTAASGQYEATLRSEIAKSEPPTLFQVNGPVGLARWTDYCYDLTGAPILNELTSDEFALKDGNKVAGIAYVVETYGIIYNKDLLSKAGYTEDDIKGFNDLKAIAEDITARSGELGFSAFTSSGMDPSSSWRFTTHLANLPLYYEYKADGIGTTEAIKGTYLNGYKALYDLYINNSTTSKPLLGTKTSDDAVSEFVTEQAVFYQNGTWAYGDISELGDENLGMIPMYIGAEGEEKQGLCTGTENYWCINKNANPDDIQATLDFINWCVTSEDGVKAMCEEMGFVIPFVKNLPADNTLVNIANSYVEKGYVPVSWNFPTMPSEQWKTNIGSMLTAYAAGTGDWDAVASAFVDGWATEYAALAEATN